MANQKIDWSQYEVRNANPNQTGNEPIDWSQYEVKDENHNGIADNEEPFPVPEMTGLTGVGLDLYDALTNALKFGSDIPSKLERSGQYIEQHPGTAFFHNLGQLAASAANVGKGFVNAPYNLNQYLARKHLLPQIIGKMGKAIPHIPEDTGLEKALGLQPDIEKGDELVRAIPDIAGLVGAGRISSGALKNALKTPDLKQPIRQIQSQVNTLNSQLGKAFDYVESEVNNRGINKIPVDQTILKESQSLLPKTPESKALINSAKSGDYRALRQLQSDLRTISENALASKLHAEKNLGNEASSLRNRINDKIEKHFESTGHQDLADILNETKDAYREMQETYFSTPALAKTFGESQVVPRNAKTFLTQESTEMNRFMNAHPELQEALKKALKHSSRLKSAKYIGGILGIGGTAEGIRELRNKK